MTDVEQRNDPEPGRYIIFGLMVVLAWLILGALLLFKGNWLVSLKLDKGQSKFLGRSLQSHRRHRCAQC